MASRGLGLVYGGGHVGLMGVLADAVLAAGGEVLGVITASLQEREVGHDGLTELRVVDTMHERKAAMADAADAFVMLPGGFGTLDEFFEAVTWAQLGIHDKPCAVLDPTGYYAPLLRFLDDAVAARFIASPAPRAGAARGRHPGSSSIGSRPGRRPTPTSGSTAPTAEGAGGQSPRRADAVALAGASSMRSSHSGGGNTSCSPWSTSPT